MGKLFGTDGIRGIVNVELDADLAFRVGQAAAVVLAKEKRGRAKVAIGKDTRISSDMLEAALTAGLCASGAEVLPLGVIPTPGVAFITTESGADAGIVISASHNPYAYNGIKIFNGAGYKLSDELEQEIEELVSGGNIPVKTGGEIGHVLSDNGEGLLDYLGHLRNAAEGNIRGLKVVIDCANGAASRTAAQLFSAFEIDFELIKDHPNGININDKCGSTHTGNLAQTVVNGGFDLGIAFDGDADRCIILDEKGNTVDGDMIMAVCGSAMQRAGELDGNTIVATVMSNLGFHNFARERGIRLVCTDVGDRNVLERMQTGGYCLGGEQSGHLIFLKDSTTGDGQLAAIKFLSVLSASGKKASELVQDFITYPQVLVNVPIQGGNPEKERIMREPELAAAIAAAEAELGEKGRILIRPSGTEALIRVMAEAEEPSMAELVTERLAECIRQLSIEKSE